MKVGIMSMQRVRNYGSFLQAYGLKKTIESLGHEVEFVDYKVEPPLNVPEPVVQKKSALPIRVARKCYHMLKGQTAEEKNFWHMVDQRKEFFLHTYDREIRPMLGIDDTMHYRTQLDALVIGSDEVFNCLQESKDIGYSRELFGKDNQAKRLINDTNLFR